MPSCPCHSRLSYNACCKPLHNGIALAQTPEQLMRSRYCAFVMHQERYILLTHSLQTRDSVSLDSIEQWNMQCQWLALEIVTNSTDAVSNKVEFIAWYKENAQLKYHHELSQFSHQAIDANFSDYLTLDKACADAWFYHSATYPTRTIKLPSRNDSCICRSGKKFKKCCG